MHDVISYHLIKKIDKIRNKDFFLILEEHSFFLLKIMMRLSCKKASFICEKFAYTFMIPLNNAGHANDSVQNNSVKDAERSTVSANLSRKTLRVWHPAGKVPRVRGYGEIGWGGDVERRVWESLWNFARGARKRRARPPACERRKITLTWRAICVPVISK